VLIFPPVRTDTISPRVQELADRLVATIDELKRYRPDLTDRDVRAALELVRRKRTPVTRIAVVGVTAAAAAIAGILTFAANEPASAQGLWTASGVVVLVAVLAAVLALVLRARGDS